MVFKVLPENYHFIPLLLVVSEVFKEQFLASIVSHDGCSHRIPFASRLKVFKKLFLAGISCSVDVLIHHNSQSSPVSTQLFSIFINVVIPDAVNNYQLIGGVMLDLKIKFGMKTFP